jgi:hypothetical protein
MDLAAARVVLRRVDICEAMACDGRKADSAVAELMRRKAVVRIGRGMYRYAGAPQAEPEAEIEEKIWRAMKINPTWTAADIAMLAGTSVNYVYKKVRWFQAEGLIKRAGVLHVHAGGGAEKLWRVTTKGRNRAGRPVRAEYKPDPLVVDVVALNRLVCTGAAQRFEERRLEALDLCMRIASGLELGEGETRGRGDGETGRRGDRETRGEVE